MPREIELEMVLYTCPERKHTLSATMRSLGETDWRSDFRIITDTAQGQPSLQRMATTFHRALFAASESNSSHVLVAEDDLVFNHHLEHNVRKSLELGVLIPKRDRITPLALPFVLSLYRSSLAEACGTQALVATPATFRELYINARFAELRQPIDAWLRHHANVAFHKPSLVNHNAHRSSVGHVMHKAIDFDAGWRAA